MSNQEKIKFLKQYKELDRSIEQQLEELAHWRGRATKMNSPLSGMPMPRGGGDSLQAAVGKICELEKAIDESINELQEVRKSVRAAIETVGDATLQTLLKFRYLNGFTFEQIAVCMNFNYRWVLRLHGRALDKLAIESHI